MIFQMIAIVILLAFYGCYYIKMFLQNKKGIKTDQIGKGKVGIAKKIEIIMKVATFFVPVIEIISIILNIYYMPIWARIIGVIISITGLFVFIISVITMKDSWRAGVSEKDKTELITKGIYQISRNPAFLGFNLVYLGILIMFFNWSLFIVSIFATFMFHLQIIKVEEVFLKSAFGNDYLLYKKRVNRYFGKN